MCSSISSIRSSAPSSSSSSSRRLRRIVQQQQEKEKGASDKKRMDVRKADHRPMEWSRDFEKDCSDSGKSFASSTSGKSSSVSPACPAPEQKRKDLSPLSKSPTAIFFRMLFRRCLTTRKNRRNRRNRVLATKLLTNGNGDYQTQEEKGNTNDGNVQKRHSRSRSIPTNEHEMFFQLHSTSRRSLNAQGLAGSSSHSRSFPTRLSRNSAATRRYDDQRRITTVQTDSPPPTAISPLLWSSIEAKGEHYDYRE